MGAAAVGDRLPTAEHRPLRILVALQVCYLDFSNGAATSVRDLMVALAARGHACRVLCGPRLDTGEPGRRIVETIARMGLPMRRAHLSEPAPHTLIEIDDRGVQSSIVLAPDQLGYPPPEPFGRVLLGYYEQLLRSFGPDLVLSFGDSWIERELHAAAARRGIPVAYVLCNYGFRRPEFFTSLHPFTCSAHLTEHYKATIGVPSTPLHPLCDPGRVLAAQHEPQYLTFVSPVPGKGAYAVARMVAELNRRRPDIPVLVVQGRGDFNALGKAGIDLTGLQNLHAMWTTEEARDFYRVTRALLMPSVSEPFGMVAVEALANGIPVLGSRRAGLVEALHAGGFLLEPLQSAPTEVPSLADVEPWLQIVERLWDDPEFYAAEQARARAAAESFRAEALAPLYEAFFRGITRWQVRCEDPLARTWLLPPEQPREVLMPPARRPKAKIETLRFQTRG